MRWSVLILGLVPGIGSAAPDRPARQYDLQHVRWKVEFDLRTATVKGDVVNTVKPLRAGLWEVRLDAGPMEIKRVEADWAPAVHRRSGEAIYVRLPKPANPNRLVHIRVVYEARPTAGAYFVADQRAFPSTTGMVYTQGEMEDTRYWLPTYDFPDDFATSEGTLVVPGTWNTLSNGKLLGVKAEGKQRLFRWKMDKPHATYLISFVAGRYAEIREDWDGIPVVSYVPPNLVEEGKRAFAGTAEMVGFFSRLTGYRYPFQKFAQSVVADFPYGGMENITAVTNTIGCLAHEDDVPFNDAQGLVLHELAHQWFGDVVTCRDWRHIWLNEGFATLLPALYVREKKGREAFDLVRADLLEGAISAAEGNPRALAPSSYETPISVFDGHAYAGGAARLLQLMDRVGEDKFWAGVRAYLSEHQHRPVTTTDFFRSFSKAAGADLGEFQRRWVEAPVRPELTARIEGAKLVLEQPEPLPRRIKVLFARSGREVTAEMAGARLELPVAEADSGPFLVDPAAWDLVRVRYPNEWTADDWIKLWSIAPNAGAKSRLVSALGQRLDALQADTWIGSEPSVDLQVRMIGASKALNVPALTRLADHVDVRIRNAALSRLAEQPNEAAARLKLESAFRNEKSSVVRETALRGLLAGPQGRVFADEAWRLPTYTMNLKVAALSYYASADPGLARSLALQQLRSPEAEPVRREAIRVLGAVKDQPGSKEVLEVLMRTARERAFGPKIDALNALARYGEASALPVVEECAKSSSHFVREAAKAAAATLRRGP